MVSGSISEKKSRDLDLDFEVDDEGTEKSVGRYSVWVMKESNGLGAHYSHVTFAHFLSDNLYSRESGASFASVASSCHAKTSRP